MNTVTVFAPATSANLGPGFDLLGVAIDGLGDWVTATRREEVGVIIEEIEGDEGRLPREADENTAGIAAREALRLIGADVGVTLHLRKGLPLGSGLGSSAASAAAAAWAVNALFGQPLSKRELLPACLVAEANVSGWHADNVGPSLFGGFLLIRSYDPLDIIPLPTPPGLIFVLATPAFELPTKMARKVLPKSIPLKQHIANSGNLAAMIAAFFKGSLPLLGRAIQDIIVEPARAPLIPAFDAVKAAALEAGALACSISGAGPTLFAVSDDMANAHKIANAMQNAFQTHAGLTSDIHIAPVDQQGARIV
ncbi:MAG: homoserine kinase [Ardenticatenaceae bacterium]